MSLYQWAACADGWNAAHSADGGVTSPSAEEFRAALRQHGHA